MWGIDNRTPFAVDRTWIRDSEGAEIWVVAVKATYDILPDGSTRIAAEQPPVNSGAVPHDDWASLRYETDLGPAKPATDIILNGHAHAQDEQPVTELLVGFRIGSLTRTAKVYGDRHWQRGLLLSSPSKPEPFLRMPLVYERAFGGDSAEAKRSSGNPVGRGIIPDAEGRIWLPNIESIEKPIRSRGDTPPVICFGAIPSHWPERRQYAGTYDQAWLDKRHPLLPEDLDPRYWQIAPAAQQVERRIKGGESIMLVNLTSPGYARNGRLAFTLPKVTLAFETLFYDGTSERSRSVIHTLILEPDFPRVSVVYHMTLPCHPKVNMLNRTRVTQKQRPLDRPAKAVADDLDWPGSTDRADTTEDIA